MDTGLKVIVVDDEKRICSNVEKILKKKGYEVTKAESAKDALDKMAKDSFSLLISDIVMPEMNGLELLKMVKTQWPLTKAVMMTAYASTDTAVKAIRLGALDYIPKPFTPDELRSKVEHALSGGVSEVEATPEEKETINIIDLDIPFDNAEVAKQAGEDYVKTLGRGDMPVVEVPKEVPSPAVLENFCSMGEMVCDIYKKLGGTCKGGLKKNVCPQKAKKKSAKKQAGQDTAKLVGIDMPFSYEEVASVTGPEYISHLHNDGVAFVPYEELKNNVAAMQTGLNQGRIDVDMPFDAKEVAEYTGEDYARHLGPSDMPVVEMPAEVAEQFCAVGEMVCDIYKKLGATCKAGLKKSVCPQKAKKAKAKKVSGFDAKKMISVELPFDYQEVAAATGPEYIQYLHHESMAVMPYEELKANVAAMMKTAAAKAQAPALADEVDIKDILVVDDEVAVNNNIRKIMAKKGFDVDQAVTKAEALGKIKTCAYRIILLDLRIPGVKGLELLKAIRDTRPEAKVIIITGYASIETAVEATRMGAIDYLPKPFTPDEIRSAADRAFKFAA